MPRESGSSQEEESARGQWGKEEAYARLRLWRRTGAVVVVVDACRPQPTHVGARNVEAAVVSLEGRLDGRLIRLGGALPHVGQHDLRVAGGASVQRGQHLHTRVVHAS